MVVGSQGIMCIVGKTMDENPAIGRADIDLTVAIFVFGGMVEGASRRVGGEKTVERRGY